MQYKEIQPNSTISLQLLKSIFGIYCIISISVTRLQMVGEFHHQKDQLTDELLQIKKIFGNAIATAVWTLDDSQLLSVMKGILELNNEGIAKGTGLGLSITKALVDRMGGQIGVVSKKNKGSIFSVWLPIMKGIR